MFNITATDIINLGRTSGGDRFTAFVDSLIRVHCFTHNIPDIHTCTNERTNKQDGGVDTKVDVMIPGDETGRMTTPTIWQYKAVESKTIKNNKIKEEVGKGYSRECIEAGYAYRFCVCDDVAPKMKEDWEKLLTQEARKTNPDAPESRVLTASDLAAWANRYPAFVLRTLHPRGIGTFLLMESWQTSMLATTRQYVPVPAWDSIRSKIERHLDFSATPDEIIISVQGEAGVGKTRLVYEVAAAVTGIESLALYTIDEQSAIKIAYDLANDESIRAVLIADECSLRSRINLKTLLDGHQKRIRVITIDNSSDAREDWLTRIPRGILDTILEKNFSLVPLERRMDYARLAGGFVRLAADMCKNDAGNVSSGQIGRFGKINDYYESRLTKEQREIVGALALVGKVGYRDNVKNELDEFCYWLDIDQREFQKVVNQIHDVPGFIARAGRYYYVTPEIIAQVAFVDGWRHFAQGDAEDFLARIPEIFLEDFRRRVSHCDDEEVKRLVGEFFRKEADEFTPDDLADSHKVGRLVTLIETDPDAYLRRLRYVVESATYEQRKVGRHSLFDGWDGRRKLVWLLERLVAFPQYFDDAEYILRKLALAESESNLSNNSTGVWKSLFTIAFSGTATPFSARLKLLEGCIYSQDEAESHLAFEAFDAIFDDHWSRSIESKMLGSRMPPNAWEPNRAEYQEGLRLASCVLSNLAETSSPRLSSRARQIALDNLGFLLHWQFLDTLKTIFAREKLSETMRYEVTRKLETYVRTQQDTNISTLFVHSVYLTAIEQWLNELRPVNLHGRLVAAISVSPWEHLRTRDEEEWQAEIKNIALQLYSAPETFQRELDWLTSAEAQSAYLLGQEVGTLDANAMLLEPIVTTSVQSKFLRLAQGYIRGLMDTFPAQNDRVNPLLDALEQTQPAMAYELFMSGGDLTRAYERLICLVDKKRLPSVFLQGYLFGNKYLALSTAEFANVLRRLLDAYNAGETDTLRLATNFTFGRLQNDDVLSKNSLLHDAEVLTLLWRLVEIAPDSIAAGDIYHWAAILKRLIEVDPCRVSSLAVNVLVGSKTYLHDQSMEVVLAVAEHYPDCVIAKLGAVMFDKEKAWYFFVDDFKSLIAALPTEQLILWIQEKGVEAARRMARHLPVPYLDAEGNPIVPALTEFVLKTFETDERVFDSFRAGMHSFQMYSGDIAAAHEAEAQAARQFLHYPLQRIREWAQSEIASAQHQAKWERQRDEEERIAS